MSRDGASPGGSLRIRLGGFLPLVCSLAAAVAFSAGQMPPARLAVALLTVLFLMSIGTLRMTPLSLLPRFMMLLYFLPFSSLVALIVLPTFLWSSSPQAADLILDSGITDIMVMTGLVGLLALWGGMAIGGRPGPARVASSHRSRVLGISLFLPMLFVALVLSWLSAHAGGDTDAYFTDALQAASEGGANGSLYVASHVLLMMLGLDVLMDPLTRRARLKAVALGVVTAYVVVVLQLMRGDRESFGLVVAMGALYITQPVMAPADWPRAQWKRVRRIVPVFAIMLAAFLAVGQLRYSDRSDTGGFSGAVAKELSTGGTWTAVLLGNLGVANEYAAGGMAYLHGQTYLDYALSLPPGFITRAMGLTRPLEATNGPGLWYYPLQWGGVHPVLVPFRNFGIWGVAGIMAMFGWLIGTAERTSARDSFWPRLLYGTVFLGAFNWFWYGDMPFIRTVMAALISGALYQLLPTVGWRTAVSRRTDPSVPISSIAR